MDTAVGIQKSKVAKVGSSKQVHRKKAAGGSANSGAEDIGVSPSTVEQSNGKKHYTNADAGGSPRSRKDKKDYNGTKHKTEEGGGGAENNINADAGGSPASRKDKKDYG